MASWIKQVTTVSYQGASFGILWKPHYLITAHSEGEGSWGFSLLLNFLALRASVSSDQLFLLSSLQFLTAIFRGPVLKAGSSLAARCVLWQERHSSGHFLKSTVVAKSEKYGFVVGPQRKSLDEYFSQKRRLCPLQVLNHCFVSSFLLPCFLEVREVSPSSPHTHTSAWFSL